MGGGTSYSHGHEAICVIMSVVANVQHNMALYLQYKNLKRTFTCKLCTIILHLQTKSVLSPYFNKKIRTCILSSSSPTTLFMQVFASGLKDSQPKCDMYCSFKEPRVSELKTTTNHISHKTILRQKHYPPQTA